jgi:uncharacterized protein YndB with AHSA1/START domain
MIRLGHVGPGATANALASEHTYTSSVTVDAPAERVWELMCDTSRYAHWGAQTLEITRVDGPIEMGSTYDERVPFIGPWKAVLHWRVSELDPPRRQVHTGEVWYARKLVSEMECAPAKDGTCFTMTLRATPRLGPLGGLLERALAASVQRNWDRTVENFKELVEGTPEEDDDNA